MHKRKKRLKKGPNAQPIPALVNSVDQRMVLDKMQINPILECCLKLLINYVSDEQQIILGRSSTRSDVMGFIFTDLGVSLKPDVPTSLDNDVQSKVTT